MATEKYSQLIFDKAVKALQSGKDGCKPLTIRVQKDELETTESSQIKMDHVLNVKHTTTEV